jgi:hypothetical protein
MAQQPKSGLSRLIVEVSWLYAIRDTHTHTGSLWTSDQLVADTDTYITNAREELQWPKRDSNPPNKRPLIYAFIYVNIVKQLNPTPSCVITYLDSLL